MERNGTGITTEELNQLPETNNILWQDDKGPTTVIDGVGNVWFIGLSNGVLHKRRGYK